LDSLALGRLGLGCPGCKLVVAERPQLSPPVFSVGWFCCPCPNLRVVGLPFLPVFCRSWSRRFIAPGRGTVFFGHLTLVIRQYFVSGGHIGVAVELPVAWFLACFKAARFGFLPPVFSLSGVVFLVLLSALCRCGRFAVGFRPLRLSVSGRLPSGVAGLVGGVACVLV